MLSNPESALFLEELYYEEYCHIENKNSELVFGAVLKRDNEDTKDFNQYNNTLKDYIRYDIKKFFNLTVFEFLDSTSYEKRGLIEIAIEQIEKLERDMTQIANANRTTGDTSELNDLFGMEI